jgi:hypothetical protein
MQDSVLYRIFSRLRLREESDLVGLYTDPPESASALYPEVGPPDNSLSPTLLASRWTCGDLRCEYMPKIAADLLEVGYDTPSLRRLAGEMQVSNSEAIELLVGAVFREIGVGYPMSERKAKLIASRQIAREVIAGVRNAWAAASYLEIVVWNGVPETAELESVLSLHDEMSWKTANRPALSEMKTAVIKTFATLASSIAEAS